MLPAYISTVKEIEKLSHNIKKMPQYWKVEGVSLKEC